MDFNKPVQQEIFPEGAPGTAKTLDSKSPFPPPPEEPKSEERPKRTTYRPLAARMRPRSLEEIAGQRHIVGPDCLLPRLLANDALGSLLLYGPPGCGKTTLAEVIALESKSRFLRLNAVASNVAELREVLRFARHRPEERPILFIDEIHRFNKSQQDLLLPDVEEGHIRLIGATTHSPGHYINPPLLSRSQLFRLEALETEEVVAVLRRAVEDPIRGLGSRRAKVTDAQLATLARLSDGDLRRALNALETLLLSLPPETALEDHHLETFARERHIRYDADQDEHYDTISAFIKSVRGNDPDAALYWLVKMLEGGEDPRFIARRLVILASEDIGLADSRALTVATSAFQAVDFIGMPEARYTLAHATLFLALAPKSNSANLALHKALETLRKQPVQPVPVHLRDSSTATARSLGNGEAYLCSHDFAENVSGQSYLATPLKLYEPKEIGAEKVLSERLQHWKELRRQRQKEGAKIKNT
jgi:putative ATPase